jgi:hypothetical protein
LRPVSELQRTVRFDDYDLSANRAGLLSRRQRIGFIVARLLEHFAGALTAGFSLAWVANTLHFSTDLVTIGWASAALLLVTAIYLGLHIRPAFAKSVVTVKGPLKKHSVAPLEGFPYEQISIGTELFFVRPEVYDFLEEDAVYLVYYIHRSPRVGGPSLLAVEPISPAPAEDDFED